MCYKYLHNGSSRYSKEGQCEYMHPKMCQASIFTGNACREIVTITINRELTDQSQRQQKSPGSLINILPTPIEQSPLMDLNLPPYNHPQASRASKKTTCTHHILCTVHWTLNKYYYYYYYICHWTWSPHSSPPLLVNPHMNGPYPNNKLKLLPSHIHLFLEQMNASQQQAMAIATPTIRPALCLLMAHHGYWVPCDSRLNCAG